MSLFCKVDNHYKYLFHFFIHFASLLCTELNKVFPVKIMILKITHSTTDNVIRQKIKWIPKKVFVNRIYLEKLLNQLKLLGLFSNNLAFLEICYEICPNITLYCRIKVSWKLIIRILKSFLRFLRFKKYELLQKLF